MRFSAEWQDDAVNAAPEEQATVADLRLCLDQQNVCLHLRGVESIDHITIPLYPLAEGLAQGWWTLFGGRDLSLSLIGYRSGYAVPDIRLSYDGAAFTASAEQCIYTNPDVRFWSGSSQVMTRAEAENDLSALIDCVLDRLNSRGIDRTTAALRWARVQASREDPEETAFCEAAGALRLDPYQIGDAAADAIERASALFQGEALTEFLSGTGLANTLSLVDWVEQTERRAPSRSRVADLQDAADAAAAKAPDRPGEPGWALGYRRARALRDVLGFNETRRFETFRQLAEALGASRQYELAPPANGIRLLRSHRGREAHLHMRIHGRSAEAQASHLFTFARGVGDVVCFPGSERATVNEIRSAYRQAAGRAFAAEFLAPASEVLSMRENGRDTVAIAEAFAVSTEVIERLVEHTQQIATV